MISARRAVPRLSATDGSGSRSASTLSCSVSTRRRQPHTATSSTNVSRCLVSVTPRIIRSPHPRHSARRSTVWRRPRRVLPNVSLAGLPPNGATGIDVSGVDRAHVSTHCTKRTDLTIQRLKTTLLVDTAADATLGVQARTTRKHGTQIAPQVARRNAATTTVLTGETGDDDQKLRRLARDHDARPHQAPRVHVPPQDVECSAE